MCCSTWGCKESDMSERLNNNLAFEINRFLHFRKRIYVIENVGSITLTFEH